MTRVTQPAPRTADALLSAASLPRTSSAPAGVDGEPSLTAAVDALVDLLDRAADELLAAVPFMGDQHSGAVVNGYVDDIAAAVQEIRADADDLRRVLAIAQRRALGGSP